MHMFVTIFKLNSVISYISVTGHPKIFLVLRLLTLILFYFINQTTFFDIIRRGIFVEYFHPELVGSVKEE